MGLNTFIDLSTPSGPGVGPAVDVSALSEGATMVAVGPGDGEVVLEISCDGGANFSPVTQSLIPNPPSKILASRTNRDIADPQDGKPTSTGGIVAQYARARRLTGAGGSKVSLASATSTRNLFATLSKVPIPTVSMGPFKTIVVCGTYAGQVVVEGSTDGTNYDAVAMFDTGGSDVRCVEGSFVAMRLRPSASAPSGSVSVGAGFVGGLIGTGVLQFDSVRVVGVQLAGFVTSGLPPGTIAYVGNDTYAGKNSVHDNYRLVYGESLTVDTTLGLDVVNSPTFALDGAQWIRLEEINQQASQKLFWALDPSNSTGVATDENTGWGASQNDADAFPLLTMKELVRRTRGAVYTSTVVFHQLSDMNVGCEPLDVETRDGNGYPVWLGKDVQVFPSGTGTVALTTYSGAVPASNLGPQISVSSLPVSFTASGLVGLFIESADGTRIARVQKDLGSKTARITTPCNPDVFTYNSGDLQTFTNGEQVRFVSFPQLTCSPFKTSGIAYGGISDVRMRPVDGSYSQYDFGSVNTLMMRAIIDGAFMKASSSTSGNALGCVGIDGYVILSGGVFTVRFGGALNAEIYPLDGGALIVEHAPWDMQGSQVIVQNSSFTTYGAESSLSIFDSPRSAIYSGGGTSLGIPIRINPGAMLYGTGNLNYLVVATKGTVTLMSFPANCFATTSAAKPLLLGTVEKDYADLPVVDLTTLTGMLHG